MPDTAVIRAQWYPCFVTPRFLTTTARRVDTFLQARGVVARDRKMPRVSEVGHSVGRKRERPGERERERERERGREGGSGRRTEGERERIRPRIKWILSGPRRRAPVNLSSALRAIPAVFRIVAIYFRASGKCATRTRTFSSCYL